MTVIDHNEIDCIVYPEHSSISALVDRIMKLPEIGKREVATILCRPAAWPDRSSGYELDLLGRERLAQAKNVLILEDETYTGGSVKSLATLCFEVLEGRLGRLAVYTVIDSMMHTERRVLTRLLREASVKTSDSQQKEQPTRPEIRLYAFMHLSVSPYWNESTCPMCRIIANLSQLLEQSPGPIENRYASNRIAELTPKSMDQDLGARSRLHKLREVLELQRNRMTGSVAISTREGLEMFCEEAYVEGDIAWLVTHINPQHPDSFLDPNVMLALIALLARDMRLLRRVGLSERLLVNINAVLATRVLHAKHLGLLMETLCGWPLHCLQEIWDNLFHTVFEESNDDFVESYGGAHLLLTDVCQRYEHPIRSALLKAFDTQVLELYHQAAPSDRPRRTKVHMAMCLRRTSYWPSQHVRTFGELISELSFLLGFFAPDKIEHRILSRGLDDLLQETEPTKPVRHIHVVQIAEHIRTDLASLVQLEMSALNGLQTNPNYGALLTAITDLQHAYPSMDSPHIGGNELRTIQGCADKIRMLLYVDEEPESLPSVLKKFLNEYRCTPRKMLGHIIEWAGTDQNVTLNNSLSDAELVNEDLLVVLNDEAVCEIFQELTTNLKRAKKRRDDGFTQKRKTDLFEVPPRFEVVVWHEKTIDKLILFLRSPCAKDDFERLTAASGVGLRSLKNAVDFLGHSYEASWDEPTATLTQKFSLRRIHR